MGWKLHTVVFNHLAGARSIQRVSGLREQRPAWALGGALGCKASAFWGVCECVWQHSRQQVSVTWETEDAQECWVNLKSALHSCWSLDKASGKLFAG